MGVSSPVIAFQLAVWRQKLRVVILGCLISRVIDTIASGQYPVHMKSITYTAARENLAATINGVCEDNAPVIITRNRDQSVVMLSLAEYESLQETAHLLRSPANAKRLLDSIDAIKRGKVVRKKINLDE